MKVRRLSALAGAASVVVGGAAQAVPTIGATVSMHDPFLVANNLWSATIRLEGIAPGETIQGFIGTPNNPWNISTTAPGGFYNLGGQWGDDGSGNPSFDGATSFYAATSFSAPGSGAAGLFDSGFLGFPFTFGEPAGEPGSGIGGFALSGDGSSDSNISPAAWISIFPFGFDPPQATYNFLRLTWAAGHSMTVNLLLAMNTPAGEVPLGITIFIPAPGALALLGLAGLVGSRRRRN